MIFAYLLVLVPISLALAFVQAPPLWVFASSVAAIVPLAEWIRRGTEQVARRAGAALGGLLNVSLGNLAELLLGLFVLNAGHEQVVKGQITGAIIANSLLGLGLAIVVGSLGRSKQTFRRERAGLLSSLLILAVIGLMLPALFDLTQRRVATLRDVPALDERLSVGVSVVLILVYLANLFYTLVTHRDIFEFQEAAARAEPLWPLRKSVGILVVASALVALEAEIVAKALEPTAERLGLTTFFLGVVVIAVIGNAAEYVAAIYFARTDRMGLVISITVGSSIQIALMVAPLLVLISHFLGHPMNLVFDSPLELIAIAGSAFAVNSIAQDGETTWFEGVLLLAVYVVFALAFFFVTPAKG